MINTTGEVTIEPFNGDQTVADAVAALHLQVRLGQREEGSNAFHPNITPIHDSQADLRGMQSYYVEPGGNFWIARDDTDRIVGFIGLKRVSENVGALKRMSVIREYRRRGIGQRLGETLIDWARDHDFESIELGTSVTEEAHDLYLKLGFVDIGFGKGGADYQMQLDLTK